jgi:AraC-like DNA-binding protein
MYIQRTSTEPVLKSSVQAIWHSQMQTGDRSLIVPDAATDIIVKSNGTQLEVVFCGTMTKAVHLTCNKEMNYWGMRFQPGHGSLFFDFPIATSNNCLINISEKIDRNRIHDLMNDPVGNSLSIEKIISDFLVQRLDEIEYAKDLKTINFLAKISFGNIEEQAKSIGVSRRHLNRIYKSYFGYSAREASRIFKFKKLIECFSKNQNSKLSDLAINSDFYDQSDMNNCVKDFCDMTPLVLMSHLSNI